MNPEFVLSHHTCLTAFSATIWMLVKNVVEQGIISKSRGAIFQDQQLHCPQLTFYVFNVRILMGQNHNTWLNKVGCPRLQAHVRRDCRAASLAVLDQPAKPNIHKQDAKIRTPHAWFDV